VTLRLRTTLFLTLAAAATALAVSAASYASTRDAAIDEIDGFLSRRALAVAAVSLADIDLPDFGPGRGNPLGFRTDAEIQVIDADGSIRYSTGGPALPVEDVDLAVAAAERPPALRSVRTPDGHYRMITAPAGGGSAVQVARDLTEEDAVLADLRTRLALIGAAAVAAAALISWLVAGRALRPVRRLTAAAEQVAATQDLDAAIEVSRADEVGRLAAAFNTMLEALEGSRRQQQQLVVDAEHELRTPLTSLRTNLEVLERQPDMAADDRAALLADVEEELAQLTHLVTQLVQLAADPVGPEQPPGPVRLDEVAVAAAERLERRTGRRVGVDAEPVTVEGRADRLLVAIGNLLDNAHKWSPPDAGVHLEVAAGRVLVRDGGPGIPAAERERVFDRFHRIDEARGTPGTGLGLSIVREIAAEHGGRVWADEAPGGGAEVGFEIPTLEGRGVP
jgi:two-component system sensor histidine kinase MprB